jgi:hypothetical protein
MLEICTLRLSFLPKFNLVWHHEFESCAPLIAFLPDLGALYTLRRAPKFYEIHLQADEPGVDFMKQFMPYA